MTKFYLDMDDTLMDFSGHAVACGVPAWSGTWYADDPSTWNEEQRAIQFKTNEIMCDANFWMNMPINPGAFEIIAAAATRGETYLLTAYPRTCPDKAMVERCKIDVALSKLHFPSHRVIVCDRHEKVEYAMSGRDHSSRNVLIDDAHQNCKEWDGAGGWARQYNPAYHGYTIRWLREF